MFWLGIFAACFISSLNLISPLPESDKTTGVACCIPNGMTDVAVTKVILDEAGISSPFCQFKSTRMPQHMGMSFNNNASLFSCATNNTISLLA
ncbi:hypothetical protein HMPREF9687_05196 [Klebsiella oxytoca 10-5243]|nr:hypothetical protein HMPREF9687_05196 [Klebsiella oxytoca 10-5243]